MANVSTCNIPPPPKTPPLLPLPFLQTLELDSDHATPTLKEIMCSTPPTPYYVRFHDTYLRK